MERFRSQAHLYAAQGEAVQKRGIEEKEFESDQVILDAAYKKAMDTETDQIQMADFADVYGEDQIKAHQIEVDRLKHLFDQQANDPELKEGIQLGKILEAIVIEQIELNEWMGPNATTQQTCEYDDFRNGIDFVTEFNEEGATRHMGFAIDATYGKSQTIQKKFEKIRAQLDKGQLGEVMYFQTGDQGMQGRKRFIPRIVLAIDKQNLVDIARLWVQGKQTELSQHPIKETIIQEVLDQLQAQLNYANALEQKGKDGATKLVSVLSSQLEAMKGLRPSGMQTKSKNRFVDSGALRIRERVASTFDVSNVDLAEENALLLQINKKRKYGMNTRNLERQYEKMVQRREQGLKQEIQAPIQEIQKPPVVQKEQKPLSIENEPTEKLKMRYQRLLKEKAKDLNVKSEILLLEKEFSRRNALKRQQARELKKAA